MHKAHGCKTRMVFVTMKKYPHTINKNSAEKKEKILVEITKSVSSNGWTRRVKGVLTFATSLVVSITMLCSVSVGTALAAEEMAIPVPKSTSEPQASAELQIPVPKSIEETKVSNKTPVPIPISKEEKTQRELALLQDEYSGRDSYDVTQTLSEEQKEDLIRSVITEAEELRLAKMVYGEDRQNSLMERAATIWCAFNRADEWDKSISQVVVNSQFSGYYSSQKSPEWAVELARDVALRYALEKLGYEDVGRTLPEGYLYFSGSGGKNRFREEYRGRTYWDWDVTDPYDGEYDMMEYLAG